jgi:hypothetical protein
LKVPRRGVTQVSGGLRIVDGVPAIVAGAIAHMGNQLHPPGAVEWRRRREGTAKLRTRLQPLVDKLAEATHDVNVRGFTVAANVVDLARFALCQGQPDGGAVVLDMKPVANLQPVAIYRQDRNCWNSW